MFIQKENNQVNNHDGNDPSSGEDEEDDYDADPTDGWERKIRMLNSELAGDNAELAGKETRASRVKANRAFQEMIKNKSPAKSPKKNSPFKDNKSLEKSPDKSPVKKKLVFGGSREVGKRTSRMTTSQRSPSKRHVKSDINFIDPMELSTPDKKHAQTLGVALRNLLKLPKAHKWVCYEFFYSNLDQVCLFNYILVKNNVIIMFGEITINLFFIFRFSLKVKMILQFVCVKAFQI